MFLRISMIILSLVFIIGGLFLVIVPFLKKDNPLRQWYASGSTTGTDIVGPGEVIVGILLIGMGSIVITADNKEETE